MDGGEKTPEKSDSTDRVILSFRRRKTGDKNRYMVEFEDATHEHANVDLVEQRPWSYNLIRLFDVLRGERNVSSLSERTQAWLNRFGKLLGIEDRPYRLPSMARSAVSDYRTVFLFCGQVYEIRSLDGIDWQDARTVIYTGDTWEPQLDRLVALVDQYDVDVVFCSYRKASEYLQRHHDSVFWLPQATSPDTWNDYGLEKEYTCIQFGRKNPTLDAFARQHLDDDEYVDHYIEGATNLARHINESWFCLAAPRRLQSPQVTGDISPVTLRYYQAMACKSLPAGFKPREFDDIFSDDVFFLEYENDAQFRDRISYYKNHESEYWQQVERNYEIVMNNHTWSDRAAEMTATINQVFDGSATRW